MPSRGDQGRPDASGTGVRAPERRGGWLSGPARAGAALTAVGLALAGCGLLGGSSSDGTAGGAGASTGVADQTSAATTANVPPGGTQRAPTGEPVTLQFAGDVHFAGSAAAALNGFGPIVPELSAADLTMVNLETAITDGGDPADKEFTFRAPSRAFTALRESGVDVVTMANNHAMDYGTTGLRDTLGAAQAANFPVVGIGTDDTAAFRPYKVTIKGQRIAIIGATRVLDDNLAAAWTSGPGKPGLASAKDMTELLAAVRAARADADTVVVDLHWGVETHSCPGTDQTGIVPELVDAGADIVVGSHAHVLEGGGWHPSGAFVDYGLGNFVFYSSGMAANTQSGILRLTVRGRAVTQAQWLPARISGGLPRPATGVDARQIVGTVGSLQQCAGLNANPPTWGAIPAVPASTSLPAAAPTHG
ncbi:CapA family protein [Frankia sp. AgB1.9]|uniref:CapA family protein n=1 Tax=unclassified Frankia TaxID=2632575 RepID=UPI001932018B|nr:MULTISPECIES: CapA family protein [unclassified Frankia]MBL7491754.1 CapA family protein [Frankia sp. AgW1.1]MBL7551698.1 CapA family protein [Frankia sp. AgB1.9]MBL7618971.1 CapA family protein [Frankia sp. AgB1.8]